MYFCVFVFVDVLVDCLGKVVYLCLLIISGKKIIYVENGGYCVLNAW